MLFRNIVSSHDFSFCTEDISRRTCTVCPIFRLSLSYSAARGRPTFTLLPARTPVISCIARGELEQAAELGTAAELWRRHVAEPQQGGAGDGGGSQDTGLYDM